MDFDGSTSYSPVVEIYVALPRTHHLSAAYPNPFNAQATFTVAVRRRQHVRVDIVDLMGRVVQFMHEGPLTGNVAHTFTFEGGVLPGGVYLYHASGEVFQESRTVVLTR